MDPKFAIHVAGEALDGVTRKGSGRPYPFSSLAITKSIQRDLRNPHLLATGFFSYRSIEMLWKGMTD